MLEPFDPPTAAIIDRAVSRRSLALPGIAGCQGAVTLLGKRGGISVVLAE